MQYNFNAGDAIFGVGGTHSVLKNSNHIRTNYAANGTVPVGSLDGVNSATTPWLSKAGELRKYLHARQDQWDLEAGPYADGSVFQRAAQVS